MTDLEVTTTRGVDTVLQEAVVTAFKQSLRGPLIAPSDDSYDEARRVWNANIDRRHGPDGSDLGRPHGALSPACLRYGAPAHLVSDLS